MKCFKVVFLGVISIMLCACAVTIPPKKMYTLNPGPLTVAKAKRSSKTLLVMATQANGEIDSTKMAYVDQSYQINYFTRHRWAVAPAKQLTPLIAKALQNSGGFRAVVTPPFVGTENYRLTTRLLTLQQNFLTHPSTETMSLVAQLVRAEPGTVVAEKRFTVTVRAPEDNPYGGVIAANKATAQLLKQLVRFCLMYTRGE